MLMTPGRNQMSLVTVTVTGASRSAALTWKGAPKPLGTTGGGNWAVSFQEAAGPAEYSISVNGNPTDPWTAKVTDGTTTNNHSGHMSAAGSDGTGKTRFQVS
jgi:hypothetical protein